MIENLILALIISLIVQTIFFVFAFYFKTDKVTDLSYGLTFIILALFFFLKSALGENQIIVTILITAWGARIAGYLFIRILKTGKDNRFDKIRHDPIKFGGFWFFQAIIIWIILLPTLIVLNSKHNVPLNMLGWFGIIIWVIGFVIEAISDQQKFKFKSNPNNSGKWISTGVWKYSRHPNYFGEILCWSGFFIFSIPYLSDFYWLSIISPIFISFILIFISGIPPLEKRYDEKYKNNGEYQEYKRRTSILVPMPLKKLLSLNSQ